MQDISFLINDRRCDFWPGGLGQEGKGMVYQPTAITPNLQLSLEACCGLNNKSQNLSHLTCSLILAI